MPPAGNAMKNKIGVSECHGLNRCALKERTGSDETSKRNDLVVCLSLIILTHDTDL